MMPPMPFSLSPDMRAICHYFFLRAAAAAYVCFRRFHAAARFIFAYATSRYDVDAYDGACQLIRAGFCARHDARA